MTPLTTAQEAMRRWKSGAAAGDWAPLLDMLDADVTFHVPVPGFPGVQQGAVRARQFFDHLAGAVRAELAVTGTLTDGRRVAFEVSVAGRWLDRPFRQALCLVFVPDGDRIAEFREYIAWPGGADPA